MVCFINRVIRLKSAKALVLLGRKNFAIMAAIKHSKCNDVMNLLSINLTYIAASYETQNELSKSV